MNTIGFLSITADDLRHIVATAVATELDKREAEAPRPPAQPQPDDYLSRDEVARMLRLTFPTLRNLEIRGELMPVRIARRVLYRRRDVERALQSREGGRRR